MTQTIQDANDILMGGGVTSARFPAIGAVVSGVVVREPVARQQRDFRTQVPETWKDGSPKMMVVVQLQTNERDAAKPEDDGVRALYIQGKNLTEAVRAAVRAAGANGIHTGGTLTVQYVADGPQEQANLNPPKLYAVSYQPPAVSFTGTTPPAATAPVMSTASGQPVVHQQQIPVPAPAAVPVAAPVMSPTLASMQPVPPCPPGVDPAIWAQMAPTQRDAVLAALRPAGAGAPSGY